MDEDQYSTIRVGGIAEIKVKGSRFIGTAQPITSEEQASEFIQQISRQFYNATHNCYAFSIGHHDLTIARYSDAGEPAGTAGLPILNVIRGKQLSDVIVVVTRYFGGTKLGKGGLIRAYSQCTQKVLEKCPVVKKYLVEILQLEFDYNFTGAVMKVISAFNARVRESIYHHNTRLILSLRQSKVEQFKHELLEATSGKIFIQTE